MNRAGVIYQFCILLSIIGLTTYFAITTNELNDTLIGALVGVMAGLSFNSEQRATEKKEEVNQYEDIS